MYIVVQTIDSFIASNEVASGLLGLLVFIACFHLLFSQYFDNRRREEAFASYFLVVSWKIQGVLRQPITLNRFPYLCPIFHVTFLSSFLWRKKGKKGDARWAIFMVPPDMVERTEPYGICECQPQPQQFATLATLKKPSVIHYVVMSYIDYCCP